MALSKKAKTKLLFADAEGRDLTRLSQYEKVGGYKSLKSSPERSEGTSRLR